MTRYRMIAITLPAETLREVEDRRRSTGESPVLAPDEARREAEGMLAVFDVLYPTEAVVRTAVRGAAAYGLSWFGAHLWAYAECYGLSEIVSEDFSHGQLIGSVRIRNPFLQGADPEITSRSR